MNRPPALTDIAALSQFRARARHRPEPAFFLQEEAASEIQERLAEVNRTFNSPAVVTPFPEIWQNHLPNAKIVADEEVLALSPDTHDLVIHAMSLHWANDPVGQLIQCRRALIPDGLFLGATFGGQTLVELRAALSEAETATTGGLSPRVLPMGEIRDLGALLQRAGFALPVADAATHKVSYRSAYHLMRDIRAMGESNALTQRRKSVPARTMFPKAAQIYADHYATGDGRIPATFEIIFLTGWSPDDSQQKPLRPGSAITRLADALGTDETSLPEAAPMDRD